MRTEAELYVETGYKILYEDDFFLVVDKPAPLPVHAVGRFRTKNLLSILKNDLRAGPEGLQIVNRLDSETSGLVLVSKSSVMAGRLGILFEKREVLKEYHAVVFGIPEPREGTISIALGTKLETGHNIRTPDPEGEAARTDYQVLTSFPDHSFLKITPHTGRTHQIRAHLSFLGHPIVGDKIYIDPGIFERYIHEGWQENMRSTVKTDRLLLHATTLAFRHPATGESMKFSAEIPPYFDEFLNQKKTTGESIDSKPEQPLREKK